MSRTSTKKVIKRFTYDWLIRFAELHPFKVSDFDSDQYIFRPFKSKYAEISPTFNILLHRHAPNIIYIAEKEGTVDFYIKMCLFEGEIDLSYYISLFNFRRSKKLTVFISELFILSDIKPGEITFMKNNRHILYGYTLEFVSNADHDENTTTPAITPDELKYLLKFGKFNTVILEATLTEPTTFSELWPYLANSQTLHLNVKNLIYDDNIAIALLENKCPSFLILEQFDLSDKALLEMFDVLLVKQVRDYLRLVFNQDKGGSLEKAIIDKCKVVDDPMYDVDDDDVFNFIEWHRDIIYITYEE